VLTALGVLLVATALFDLFHTLFHPAARGKISDFFALMVWRASRRFWPRSLSVAGPLAFVLIVVYWAASIVLGFALIYLPHLPRSFTFSPGLNPQVYSSFGGALTVSLCCLITLSSGVYSTQIWIEFLMAVESVFGFAIVTASISWILSIYPVLEHRRSLAHEATLLHFSEHSGLRDLRDVSDSEVQEILLGLASQLTTHRNELTQFPITYYFYENESETALAGILPYMADIADENKSRKGGAAIAAITLGGAIEDYLKIVAKFFLERPYTDREQIMRAYAADHNREVVRAPRHRPRAA